MTVGQRRGVLPGRDGEKRYVSRVDLANRRVEVGRLDEILVTSLRLTNDRSASATASSVDGAAVLAQCSAHGERMPATLRHDDALVARARTSRRVRSRRASLSCMYRVDDPAVVEGAAIVFLHEPAERVRVAAHGARATQRGLLHQRRADDSRRRVRRARRESCADSKTSTPSCATSIRSRAPSGRPISTDVLAGRPRRADAQPGQRLWRRGAGPVEPARGEGPRRRRRDAIAFSVEPKIDGLALSITYVDGRTRAGGDARRRASGRRRDRERSHHQERAPDAEGGARTSRGSRRGLPRARGLSRDEPPAGGARDCASSRTRATRQRAACDRRIPRRPPSAPCPFSATSSSTSTRRSTFTSYHETIEQLGAWGFFTAAEAHHRTRRDRHDRAQRLVRSPSTRPAL